MSVDYTSLKNAAFASNRNCINCGNRFWTVADKNQCFCKQECEIEYRRVSKELDEKFRKDCKLD